RLRIRISRLSDNGAGCFLGIAVPIVQAEAYERRRAQTRGHHRPHSGAAAHGPTWDCRERRPALSPGALPAATAPVWSKQSEKEAMMSRTLLVSVLAALLLLPPPQASSAQTAPFCDIGQSPHFVFGFASLKDQIGAAMGDPIECEHANPEP